MSKIKMLLDDCIEEVIRIANKEGFEIDEEIATEILMTSYCGMTYTNLNKMDKYDHVVDYCIREFTDLYDGE
jgi:hypothetical protein